MTAIRYYGWHDLVHFGSRPEVNANWFDRFERAIVKHERYYLYEVGSPQKPALWVGLFSCTRLQNTSSMVSDALEALEL